MNGPGLHVRWVVSAVLVLLAAATAGCAPPATSGAARPALERALVTSEDVEQSIRDEIALSERYERLPRSGDPWFTSLDGCTEVLITAPHATNPTRDGRLRFPDRGTGSLVMALHRLTGARVIHTSLASPSDPNFYDDNDFKSAVAAAIATRRPVIVLDVHGSHHARPYDIDFGTMGGASLLGREDLLTRLSAVLHREGLANQSQDFFAASRNQTITKWVANRGVPAIQLEISSTWLSPGASRLEAHRYAQLLQGLTRFVRSLGCVKP